MARDAELRARITATDDASKVIDAVAKKTDALTKKDAEVTVTADAKAAGKSIDDVLKKVDKLDSDSATILLTANATQIATQITDLITDLDKLDANDPQVDVKVDQIASLKGDLDTIEGKIKEVNNVPVDIDTAPARQGIDEVGKSADSSKSVLANMVGNATQDLGALGGVAGSAGVAIGQMGEYMADAAGSGDKMGTILRNFAGVAGPIAGIALATQLVSSAMEAGQKSAALNAKNIELMTEAIRKGGNATKNYADSLAEAEDAQVQFGKAGIATTGMLGQIAGLAPGLTSAFGDVGQSFGLFGKESEKLTDLLHNSGIGLQQWSEIVTAADPSTALAHLETFLRGTTLGIGQQRDIFEAAGQAQADWAKGQENAGRASEFFGKKVEETTGSTVAQQRALDASAAALADWATQAEKSLAGAEEFNNAVASTDFGKADLTGAIAGMQAFHDQFFGLADIAANSQEAFDNFGASLKENGKSFDLNTEKGRNNQKALEELASTVDTQLAAAFDAADGDFATFQASAQSVADTLKQRLQKELHLSGAQADDMIRRLGLMPGDIETRYKLSGTEEAKAKIGLLQSAIDNLPKDVQARVTQQIIAGDYVGALGTVQGYYNSHPASVDVNAKAGSTSTAHNQMQRDLDGNPLYVQVIPRSSVVLRDAGGVVPSGGGIAAEIGPEFARLPGTGRDVLLTAPTMVPPGTRVTSRKQTARILRHGGVRGYDSGGVVVSTAPISVNISAAVIGNRFDVDRTVTRALRRHQRYNGIRP